MRKPVVFWDIDGTMIPESMERHFVRFLAKEKGFLRFWGRTLIKAVVTGKAGLSPDWRNLKLAYLRGRMVDDIDRLAEKCWIEQIKPTFYDGAERTITFFNNENVRQVMLSGTIAPLGRLAAASFGVKEVIASEPEIKKGPLYRADEWKLSACSGQSFMR